MSSLRLAALILLLVPVGAAGGQAVDVAVLLPAPAARATEAPFARSAHLFRASQMQDLLRNGFPARIHYKLERWEVGRWVDDLKATREWDVIVRYDQMARVYRVTRVFRERLTELGEYGTIAEADSVVGRLTRTPMPAPRRGERSYYTLAVELEMLSVSDLDEVERWLRGEFRPAVRGDRNPGTAITRGVRTMVIRLLGGEKRRYEARSPTFTP